MASSSNKALWVFIVGFISRALSMPASDGQTDTVTSPAVYRNGCVMPHNLPNGSYSLVGPFAVEAGQLAPHYSILQLTCPPGYLISSTGVNYCDATKNDWFEELATCQKTCRPPKSLTVEFTCMIHGKNGRVSLGSCDRTLPSGTNAIGQCRKGHHSISYDRYITCIDGRWGYSMPSCKAECGKAAPLRLKNLINGTNVTGGNSPWHVAIYTQDRQDGKTLLPRYWCAGSVISRSLVITAADCFYDPLAGKKFDADLFTVVVGKMYRDLGHPEETIDNFVQKSGIKRIEIPEYYEGESSGYTHNLAILVLKNPFNFTDTIMPVCLNLLDEDFDEQQSSPGLNARFTGFGANQPTVDISNVLKTAVVPIISKNRCRSDAPPQLSKYIVWDKLCTGETKGIAMFKDVIGSGLVVSHFEKNTPIWYLRGIMSTFPPSDASEQHRYSIFTRPFLHRQFIEDVVNKQGCEMPSNPLNGIFILVGVRNAEPGEGVAHNTEMELRCDKGFDSSDSENNFCDEFINDWIKVLATCGGITGQVSVSVIGNAVGTLSKNETYMVPILKTNRIYIVPQLKNNTVPTSENGVTYPSPNSKNDGTYIVPISEDSVTYTVPNLKNNKKNMVLNLKKMAPKTNPEVIEPPPIMPFNNKEEKSTECKDCYKILCSFTNWALYRKDVGKYLPEDIDSNLCTHIMYSFTVLNNETLLMMVHNSWEDITNKLYERVTAYKKKGVKVLASLGGWSDSAGDKYSRLVSDAAARKKFINHAVDFLQKHNFDGLDIHWKYPVCWHAACSTSRESDKAGFAVWVRELKEAFEPRGLLLSASVSSFSYIIDVGYDIPSLATHLDWITVLTYDYHGSWEKKTGHNSPLYRHPEDDVIVYNADYSIQRWIEKGAPARKLIMAIPLYGQSYTLLDHVDNGGKFGLGVPTNGSGEAGEYTMSKGMLAYYEICDRILNRGWTMVKDELERIGPYAYKGDQWVSFDDKDIIRKKSQYVKSHNLGGAMVWTLDFDDFKNICNEGAYPLLSVIAEELKDSYGTSISQSEGNRSVVYPIPDNTVEAVTPEFKKVDDIQLITSKELDSKYIMVCYFTNWAWYREGDGKYTPDDIDSSLCTHIVYAFANLDEQNLTIKSLDPWADIDNGFYEKVTAYKKDGIKVLLALGGWLDSAGDKYSNLVNSADSRQLFVKRALEFIIDNNFDGLNLYWNSPVCWQGDCEKGPASDKEGFSSLVKELRQAFAPKTLLLTATLSSNVEVINAGYDIPAVSENLDWMAVMTFDYHGQWDAMTGHVAPLFEHPDDGDSNLNINSTINYLILRGAPPSKLVLGLPMYGQSFTLEDPDDHELHSPSDAGGEPGNFTGDMGTLSYYEICDRVRNDNWEVVRDTDGRLGPYAYKGSQWVSFDDVAIIRDKISYIKSMGLGGGMVWTLDTDDFRGSCDCEAYPLLSAAARGLGLITTPQPNCTMKSAPVPKTTMMPTSATVVTAQSTPAAIQPTVSSKPSDYKIICYYTSRSWYRKGDGKYSPENIDPSLCTHIVYGFAVLDSAKLIIMPEDSWADIDNDFYGKVTALKATGVKVLIAIGGWDDSKSDKYSRLVSNATSRTNFITNVVEFIEKWQFDGLDLNWKYPRCWQIDCNAGPASDRQNFGKLVQELRDLFTPRGWLLSAAVSGSRAVINLAFDVPSLAINLDWIAVTTYEYHRHLDVRTSHVAPLYSYPGDTYGYFNANFSINYWMQKGAPAKKLIMGIPMFGQSFTLVDSSEYGLNAPVSGMGESGEFTDTPGVLAYYEICERVKMRDWSVDRDLQDQMGPWARKGKQWVSFDDTRMVATKAEFIKSMSLGGAMVWALDFDDFRDRCGCGNYPLLRSINAVFNDARRPVCDL